MPIIAGARIPFFPYSFMPKSEIIPKIIPARKNRITNPTRIKGPTVELDVFMAELPTAIMPNANNGIIQLAFAAYFEKLSAAYFPFIFTS